MRPKRQRGYDDYGILMDFTTLPRTSPFSYSPTAKFEDTGWYTDVATPLFVDGIRIHDIRHV